MKTIRKILLTALLSMLMYPLLAQDCTKPVSDSYTLSLRANLLRWATLTPDLGIEWRISPSVGIMVNSSWTSWTWNDNARRYALWEVMPEVRWYLHGQAGRPDGRRHHGRLPAAAEQGTGT